jgi:hypothetical protein
MTLTERVAALEAKLLADPDEHKFIVRSRPETEYTHPLYGRRGREIEPGRSSTTYITTVVSTSMEGGRRGNLQPCIYQRFRGATPSESLHEAAEWMADYERNERVKRVYRKLLDNNQTDITEGDLR